MEERSSWGLGMPEGADWGATAVIGREDMMLLEMSRRLREIAIAAPDGGREGGSKEVSSAKQAQSIKSGARERGVRAKTFRSGKGGQHDYSAREQLCTA